MLSPDTRLKERYRILHIIGGGGFGYVYKAIDEVFGCNVAVKETREEVSDQGILRNAFEREARLLRTLKHDSLPRVTDYFFHNQAQFLVMDFIEGEDLATRLSERLRQDKGPVSYQEALPWAEKILAALVYLHSRPKPIIHRDIKPSNIKLAEDGGIYLLDFGLAKGAVGQMSTIKNGHTSSIVPGFTLAYAPLEQMQNTGVQPQGDIYALGATLYHLLTGQLPVSASERDEAFQRGKDDPLRPAHEVNPDVPVGLSQVISQAMAVRWWNRISSADDMLLQLRWTKGHPVAGQPDPAASPTAKTVPLGPDEVSTTALLPQQQKNAPPDNVEPAPVAEITISRPRFNRLRLSGGVTIILLLSLAVALVSLIPNLPERIFNLAYLALRPPPNILTLEPRNVQPLNLATPADLSPVLTLKGHSGTIWSVAFSPDGNLAASAGDGTTIMLWDTKTWTPKFPPLTGHTGAVYSVAFSPDGKVLASGSHDKTIRIWDTQTGRLIRTLTEHNKPVLRLAFSPDGNSIASCSGAENNGDKEIRLWNATNYLSKTLNGHEGAVVAVAFSPDSSILASAGYDNTLRLWELNGIKQSTVLSRYARPLMAIAYSTDGKYLACGSSDNSIKIWAYQPETQSWIKQEPLIEHTGSITSIAFSPDNRMLVSASTDNTLRLWDVAARSSKIISSGQGGVQPVQWSVAVSPDGQKVLSGGKENTLWVWQ